MSTTINPAYNFNIDTKGDTHTFTYKRAKYGIKLMFLLCIMMGLPLWLMFYVLLQVGTPAFILGMIFSCGTYALLNVLRKDGSFVISKTHFSVNDKSYARDHVFEVYIKEPGKAEQVTQIHSTSVVGFGVAGVAAATISSGVQAGRAVAQQTMTSLINEVGKKNYQIGFLYGEGKVRLAGGLSASTADIMYRKIIEITH